APPPPPPPPSISIYNINTDVLRADILRIGESQWINKILEQQEGDMYRAEITTGVSSLADLNLGDPVRGQKRKKHKEQSGSNLTDDKRGKSEGESSINPKKLSVAPLRTINVNKGVLRIDSEYRVSQRDDIVISGGGEIEFYDGEFSLMKEVNRITVRDFGTISISNERTSKIYLNDLVIADGGLLKVTLWVRNYDHLLVRKGSQGLADALGKIHFDNEGPAGVREYNKDYWEIGAGHGFGQLPVPEPATYGAVFSLGVLGFVAWRRRGKRSLLKS
ncbi:PEP-CTERM sorting domain-containing protein, partial [Cephaloticoccus primus]|uniref:PEP-CTERM sorting domain-containing protein n=1 Tax=Cephaloticoccus primus TaxID=1548207 RepID=UPI0012E795C2